MMISKAQIQQVLNQYGDNTKSVKVEKSGGTSALKRCDSVVLSQEGLNVQQLQKRLQDVSDIRESKVREITEQVRSGTYTISGEEIAEKMLGRIIVDRIN